MTYEEHLDILAWWVCVFGSVPDTEHPDSEDAMSHLEPEADAYDLADRGLDGRR